MKAKNCKKVKSISQLKKCGSYAEEKKQNWWNKNRKKKNDLLQPVYLKPLHITAVPLPSLLPSTKSPLIKVEKRKKTRKSEESSKESWK